MVLKEAKSKVRSILFIISLVLIYFLIIIFFTIVYAVYNNIMNGSLDIKNVYEILNMYSIITGMILPTTIYIIILYFKNKNSKFYTKIPFTSLKSLYHFSKRDLLKLFFGATALIYTILIFLTLLSKNSNEMNNLLTQYNRHIERVLGTDSYFIMFLTVVILGPIMEEILFRGLIYGRLKQSFGIPIAIFTSSLLFAIVHFNVIQVTYTMVFGLFLVIPYEKTGSILIPILYHMVFNFIGILQIILGTIYLNLIIIAMGIIVMYPAIKICFKWYNEIRTREVV